jgi:serine/threonine-protein kinase
MGEVYKARDTKLGREVAIKILPDAFVADPERVARFQREAQLLAALNHPHIAGIHGLEESGGMRFLALELVDGENLAQRLGTTGAGLAVDEALRIARQIADALQAAHDKGIIHRDLKPANVMLTADGQVKVLDFGLAKLDESSAGLSGERAGMSHSPTLTLAATQAGMILGTAAYMAPEQARGRAADKRCDIWAFGCVLYEMLSGRKAFEGEDVTDTIAAVVRGEPDWTALPADVPDHIRALLKRCLLKDRKQRIPDISVALYIMDEARVEGADGSPERLALQKASLARGVQPNVFIAAGLAIAVVSVAVTWFVTRPAPQPLLPVTRFAIVPPPAQPLSIQGADRDIAISPDGSHVVYRAGGGQLQLAIRRLDQLEALGLAGLSNPRVPFFSPDGHWIGFFDGAELKKVSITGGPAITLCRLTGANPRGASWGDDNTIIFATADPATGLLSVPAGGGEPKVLTRPDAAQREGDHLFPSILPGGHGVLFTITSGQTENAQVAVLDLKTGQRKTLVRGGSHAEYVETGHLVYAAAGTLRAVRFDLARLEVVSDPVPVAEHVMVSGTGAANFAISRHGTLVYVPGGAGTTTPRQLVWVDRKGHEEPVKAPLRAYASPRISPDGTRVALQILDQENDIWVWDLARQTPTRLTFDPAIDQQPVWTPDSRRIIFSSARSGISNLYWHAADGTGADQRLTTSTNLQFPNSVTPDGTHVVGYEVFPKTIPDVVQFALDGPAAGRTGAPAEPAQRPSEPLVQTTFAEFNAEVSPDGRYLAYNSNESGQFEIYVRPYPKVNDGRWQVSTGGGTRPLWARNGRELFYIDALNVLTAVPVQTTPAMFSAGNPAKVFDAKYAMPVSARAYDVSLDGQRFLMIKEGGSDEKATPASLVVVEHWFEELKARVPAR